jgi:hypothetical protein
MDYQLDPADAGNIIRAFDPCPFQDLIQPVKDQIRICGWDFVYQMRVKVCWPGHRTYLLIA